MWPFKKSAEKLYKEKQEKLALESIRRMAVLVSDRGGITRIGCSEYGARKHLEEGTEPHEKVLTSEGDLITWEEWRKRNV